MASNADGRRMSQQGAPGTRYTIEALGMHGDGIAHDASGRPVFVPDALPGEQIEMAADGRARVVGRPSVERASPPCPHYGQHDGPHHGSCGGCMAQHMGSDLYARWKSDIVAEAFRQRGFDSPPLSALVPCAPGSRRRAVLSARRIGGRVILGYHARRSHDLVDIAQCLVLAPAITHGLPALRDVVAVLGLSQARLTVLATQAGLDVAVAADTKRIAAPAAHAIGALAAKQRFARVSLNGEPIIARSTPVLDIAGVGVTPPPGGFVQAVADAEEAMRAIVMASLGAPRRVADLFCGLGAFTLALARQSRVMAADNDTSAIAALEQALRHAQGLKPVERLTRDLFRDPLSPQELAGFDAVVLDPPRAGALAQAEALAASVVPCVAYVSCNPVTLARDARLLVDGGYALEAITPIDQFLYSDHVEAVAIFRRPRRAKRTR